MSERIEVEDDDFLSGFNSGDVATETETPPSDDEELGQDENAKQEEGKSDDVTAKVSKTEPEQEYAKITKKDYEELIAKAAAIDEIKSEYGKKFDKAFGSIGGIQQLIQQLQSSTKTGQQVKVSAADFEELAREGYSDLAEMTAAGFNRALEKLSIKGTGEETKQFNQDQINELIKQNIAPERDAIRQSVKDEIKAEIASEMLSDLHDDWKDVVKSKEFQEYAEKNKVFDKKDRAGTPFKESLDARFVAKELSAFKESLKKATKRQAQIDAAVMPKGDGRQSRNTSADDDDFLAGFNSRGRN